MATPVVAGSAALVRAYFMGGYYPPTATGAKDPARAFSPSGALVKAVLINGAAQLRGSVSVQNMNIPLEDAPSHRQVSHKQRCQLLPGNQKIWLPKTMWVIQLALFKRL